MKVSANLGRRLLYRAAVILAGSAVFILVHPLSHDRDNEWLIGGVLMVAAAVCFVSFGTNRRMYFRPGWILPAAFFMAIYGLIIIFLPLIDFDVNVTVYAFLALFLAAAQFSAAIQLRALEIKRWWWVLIFGIVNTLFGIYFLKLCSVLNLSEYPSVAVLFIFTGLTVALEPWVYMKRRQ